MALPSKSSRLKDEERKSQQVRAVNLNYYLQSNTDKAGEKMFQG